jgi:hypothetical protein
VIARRACRFGIVFGVGGGVRCGASDLLPSFVVGPLAPFAFGRFSELALEFMDVSLTTASPWVWLRPVCQEGSFFSRWVDPSDSTILLRVVAGVPELTVRVVAGVPELDGAGGRRRSRIDGASGRRHSRTGRCGWSPVFPNWTVRMVAGVLEAFESVLRLLLCPPLHRFRFGCACCFRCALIRRWLRFRWCFGISRGCCQDLRSWGRWRWAGLVVDASCAFIHCWWCCGLRRHTYFSEFAFPVELALVEEGLRFVVGPPLSCFLFAPAKAWGG